ncbi:MAG: ABC-2 transporter permease [Clostridia bacterium]|nr:ABC-2 transporter permease [Clostridia bacterium]
MKKKLRSFTKHYLNYAVIGLVLVIFTVLSLASKGNMFFVFYPCLLCGMIPVNLLGYDERSRWMQYSGTMPYTKTQLVSAKYLIGLLSQTAMLVVMGIAQGIKTTVSGDFVWNDFIVLMLMMLIMATLTSSISLPFIFKLGVEKGRTAYYLMIGMVCGASVLASSFFRSDLQAEIRPNTILIVLSIVGVGVYILSWLLSIRFFKKREIH